jgi:hypothetical protein
MVDGGLLWWEGIEMSDTEQFRALHDAYVWEVNAAVGEGRLDLVWQLADDYLDEALTVLAADVPTVCGRADCAICHRSRPAHARPRRRGWGHRVRSLLGKQHRVD